MSDFQAANNELTGQSVDLTGNTLLGKELAPSLTGLGGSGGVTIALQSSWKEDLGGDTSLMESAVTTSPLPLDPLNKLSFPTSSGSVSPAGASVAEPQQPTLVQRDTLTGTSDREALVGATTSRNQQPSAQLTSRDALTSPTAASDFNVASTSLQSSTPSPVAFTPVTGGDFNQFMTEAQELWKVEGRAGGTSTYEFAIGPSGAQTTNTGTADIVWQNGQNVPWSLTWNGNQASFTVGTRTIRYTTATPGLFNGLYLMTKVDSRDTRKVSVGTQMHLEVQSANGQSINPIALNSTGPTGGQDLDQLIFTSDQAITSLTGVARISWPTNGVNPHTTSAQSRITFVIEGNTAPVFGTRLNEGSNFTSGQELPVVIPQTPSFLEFSYKNLVFDTTDSDSSSDAFEVSLVDASGRSLVHTIAPGRDAFFNVSEGESASLGSGTSYDPTTQTVRLNLAGIAPGTQAKLVARLVNNDQDTTTRVEITAPTLSAAPTGTQAPLSSGTGTLPITPAPVNLTNLVDVSASLRAEYGRTSFNETTRQLYSEVAIRNTGTYSTNAPLLVAVKNISDPTVQLQQIDGYLSDGTPYYNFSRLVSQNNLDPSEVTTRRDLIFYNPNEVQFTYDLAVLSQLNQSPQIDTQPITEVITGQTYRYDVNARDADGDVLRYQLLDAPQGMSIDEQTGMVTWAPGSAAIGNHAIRLQASDGRGGVSEQYYTLSMRAAPPNRPPLVTSIPVVDAQVNEDYTYQVVAQDPDGDPLTYTLLSELEGMQVNPTTGFVTWKPTANQRGTQNIVVQVSDGQGDSTLQSFSILTGVESGNHNPFITSTPETKIYSQSPYRYQVQAVDPDGDALSYALLNPPEGMTIHPTTGLITWSPTNPSGAISPVTIQVQDGRGGVQEQVLTLTVEAATGEIRGQIWNDLDRDKQIDASERGMTGVQVYLDANDNQLLDAGEVTTTVDETGHYRFTGLAAGSYLVREVVPESFTLTSPLTERLGPNIITNGSFEMLPSEYTPTYFNASIYWIPVTENDPAQKQIPGWQVLNLDPTVIEDIDITPRPLWPASNGEFSVELEGYYGGNIAQTFATIPGVTYNLSFDYAGHPFFGDRYKTLEVRVVDQVERFIYDRNDPSVQASYFYVVSTGWQEGSLRFTATDTQTTLLFSKYRDPKASTTGGPLVDDVVVAPVIAQGSHLVTLAAGQLVDGINFGNAQGTSTPNQQPEITTVAPTQTVAGQFFQYDAEATDRDHQVLTYDLPVRPEGMTVDSQTGQVLWVPTADQVGLYDVVLRVRDGQGGVDLQTFQLEVTSSNAAPVFTSVISTDVRPQIGKPFTYQASALDLDGDSITYSLVSSSASTAPSGVTIDATTGVLRWTPSALGGAGTLNGEVQPWQITIQASDGKGGIALQTLDLVVEAAAPNQPPTITSTPRTTTRPGSSYFYQITATDVDGDTLTYSLDANSISKGMQIQNGLLVWTPGAEQFGPHAVVVQVSDGTHSVNQSFTLNVTHQVDNSAPVITSTPNLVANLGREYQYNLTGTDPDGDYRLWSLSQGPGGMVIDAHRGTLRWTPTLEQVAKTHTIVVRLTDALGSYVEQRFDLIATGPNIPPVIRSIPITQAGVEQEYVYRALATDAENDTLTFSLPFRKPVGMTISSSGIIRWTPAANQQGSHVIDVRVTDSRGGESTQTYTLEVGATAINHAPVITSSPILKAPTGQSYHYTVTATDPDAGSTLTYQLLERPDGMQINATSGEITWTTPVTGNHRVVVGVSDVGGLNAYQSFVLAAQANAAPTLQSTAPTQATPGVVYAYDVRATDTDGNTFTYTLDSTSLNRGMSLDALGRLRWTPSTTDLGVHPVVVTVTDAYGASVQQPFNITVAADTQAPRVSLVASTSQVTVGSQVTFQARATDNVDVAGLQLIVGNQAVVLDANGFATVTLNQTGTITARAIASDTAGNQTEVTTAVVVSAANAQAPIARFDLTGITGGVITSATNLIGTVDDPDSNSVTYTVEAAPIAGGEWRTIFTG
ncbi:putative Ig domain-containing protein, partial [Oscillatoria sp. FACHB-1407]|uniref:putative Ig domain-containing protein n=1 Tax=Oscillatoria sp. FACHB-1407 TaxID=2692847 RepID=UPI001683489B